MVVTITDYRHYYWSSTEMHLTSRDPGVAGRGRQLRGPSTCPSAGRLGTDPLWDSPSHSSQQDSFDNHLERQHQAPSQEASIPPGPPGHALSYHFLALGATVRLPRHGAHRSVLPHLTSSQPRSQTPGEADSTQPRPLRV